MLYISGSTVSYLVIIENLKTTEVFVLKSLSSYRDYVPGAINVSRETNL